LDHTFGKSASANVESTTTAAAMATTNIFLTGNRPTLNPLTTSTSEGKDSSCSSSEKLPPKEADFFKAVSETTAFCVINEKGQSTYFKATKNVDGSVLLEVLDRGSITNCQELEFNTGDVGMVVLSTTPVTRFSSTCNCFVLDIEELFSNNNVNPQNYTYQFCADTDFDGGNVTLTCNDTLKEVNVDFGLGDFWLPKRASGKPFPASRDTDDTTDGTEQWVLTVPYLSHATA